MSHSSLSGWRICVTRDRRSAPRLSSLLAGAGAVPLEVPTIEILPPSDGGAGLAEALGRLSDGGYAWIVFTSANSVDKVLSLSDLRELGGARVAAIGEGTENALTKAGVAVNLVPARFVAEALAEDFPMAPACAIARSSTTPPSIMASTAASRQILLPRAAVARTALPDGLSAKGWDVHVVEAYRTGRPELDPGAREAAARAHAVTFTASSTVTGWLELLGRDALPPVVACIGPVTAATAREARIDVTVESAVHTIDGLVEALGSYAARTAPPACP